MRDAEGALESGRIFWQERTHLTSGAFGALLERVCIIPLPCTYWMAPLWERVLILMRMKDSSEMALLSVSTFQKVCPEGLLEECFPDTILLVSLLRSDRFGYWVRYGEYETWCSHRDVKHSENESLKPRSLKAKVASPNKLSDCE